MMFDTAPGAAGPIAPAKASGPAAPAGRGRRAARIVTEAFSPTIVLPAGYVAVAAVTSPGIGPAVLYATVAVLLGMLLPYLFVLVGVRRGRISDHHIRVRGQRHLPLAIGLGCVVAGFGLLLALGAPRPLLVLFVLVIAAMVPAMAVTVWWQISVHTAVAALTVTALVALWGPRLAIAAVVVAAVGWSRVVVRAHTVAQVFAGGALGAGIGALAWPLLG